MKDLCKSTTFVINFELKCSLSKSTYIWKRNERERERKRKNYFDQTILFD